ncbi:YbhB/YbcL family Raf kinase inhibitor-like protein [Candidatus Roizmanbacteria bacterium]|nr:YbhB/YbcL family Raf kinase inhibitor-like protein [Candidatus Roizmanbacteria bacterium]
MIITSTAFQHNGYIPSKYTCDGENKNPPLTFSQVPKDARSLVFIVDDPDAPSRTFTHWVVYNIPSSTLQILEGEIPQNSVQGMTDFGQTKYGGPCPPSGVHRYFFKLFALDIALDLKIGASREEVLEAMKGHILESGELIGLYGR